MTDESLMLDIDIIEKEHEEALARKDAEIAEISNAFSVALTKKDKEIKQSHEEVARSREEIARSHEEIARSHEEIARSHEEIALLKQQILELSNKSDSN